jgi:metallo-beta-lactamase family protein
MKSIEFLGAAGEVTGSSFLLTTNKGKRYLFDAGMFQEGGDRRNAERNKSFHGQELIELDGIFASHGHLDHIGRIPFLYKADAPIYMTQATYDLTSINLRSSDEMSKGFYPPDSIEKVLKNTCIMSYNEPVSVDGITATARDAGHILGSSTFEIEEKGGEKIVFSGDLGNTPSRTVQPTSLINEADVVVMESTYGDRDHEGTDPVKEMRNAIRLIQKDSGTLLIPAFAIDRTQAVLNILKELKAAKDIEKIPVYLDAPMAATVTRDIYADYDNRKFLNEKLQKQEDPFNLEEIFVTYADKESRRIPPDGPLIIVAGFAQTQYRDLFCRPSCRRNPKQSNCQRRRKGC